MGCTSLFENGLEVLRAQRPVHPSQQLFRVGTLHLLGYPFRQWTELALEHPAEHLDVALMLALEYGWPQDLVFHDVDHVNHTPLYGFFQASQAREYHKQLRRIFLLSAIES